MARQGRQGRGGGEEYERAARVFSKLDWRLQVVVLAIVLVGVGVAMFVRQRGTEGVRGPGEQRVAVPTTIPEEAASVAPQAEGRTTANEQRSQERASTRQAAAIAAQVAATVAHQGAAPRSAPVAPQGATTVATTGTATVATEGAAPATRRSPHMLLGNPSGAMVDLASKDNYLMLKPYYALSYNNSKGTPNWVSWRLATSDMGDAPRKQFFDPDPDLPPGFKAIVHRDYSGSGFDRGHMCPNADRDLREEMNASTFVMTNIIPQAPNVNQKAWAELENYCRDLAWKKQRVYIVCGPNGKGGTGSNGFAETIGGDRVTVPSECWKIVVAVSEVGEDDLGKINAGTRVISVIMPNDNDTVGEGWARFRTNPEEIEKRTGYKFFDRLPAEVAAALRVKVDKATIPQARSFNRGGG